MIPADFHFLRPEWLLVLLPALALALLAQRKLTRGRDDWRGLVDAHLLRHLAIRDGGGARRWPLALMLGSFALAAVAMAGPTWQKVPVPALDRLDPTVIVLSLAQSMNATDQNPSRLVAARHKVDDILRRMKGGQVALVIYADAPFVAAPLTEDGRVIAQMLPELATDLMPVLNDRPDLAIRQAEDLLKNTGATTGRIILLTDGAGDVPDRTLAAARAAAQAGYKVQVIGVGGAKPVPLVAFDGRPLRGRDGSARMTQLDAERLNEVAGTGGGHFVRLASDARDIDTVLDQTPAGGKANLQASGLNADEWVDMGPYLVLALAFCAALGFRRGWLAALPLALLTSSLALPPSAHAQSPAPAPPAAASLWQNLWKTPDQRAADSFAGGDYAGAASTFQNPAWQASALYRNGDFDKAASAYGGVAGDDYNRGNALARAGKLREAVAAYDAALKADPADADAAYNREIVLKALEQQQKQQNQDQQNQDQKKDGQQNQDQKSDGKQDQAQQQPNSGKPDDASKDQQKQPDSASAGNQPPQKPQDQAGDQQNPKPQDQKSADQKAQDQKAQDQKNQQSQAQNQPQPPQQPEPQKAEPAKPEPAPAKPEAPAKEAQDVPPGGIAIQPLTEQDQNREQTLRMVPDDPTGLLRARIRSHYSGTMVPTVETPR